MNGFSCIKPAEVRLTARELEVIRLVAEGCTYSRVAERLGVSLHTVTSHIKNVYRKLDVHTAGSAVMRAVQLRMIGEN
jgi:DNA-binding CsgD family transcriptional regulator